MKNRKSLIKIVFSMILALSMIFGVTFTAVADDWDDHLVECEYCGELVLDWALCDNCGGCSEECNPDCWAEHHCGGCGACLVSEDPSSYCAECCLCSDCWDDSIHCDGCYSCEGDVCPFCGLCNECADMLDLLCMDCGENHLCDSFCDNLDENMIWHCKDCCVICPGCGECWHSRGGYEVCDSCGLCPECCEDEEYHCPECGQCYEEVGRCESGAAHCTDCCESSGYFCFECNTCFAGDEDEFCEECEMCINCAVEHGLHCPECLESHVECEECGLCLDCAEDGELHCHECGRCFEEVGKCDDDGDHCRECCEENEWICPECGECSEATGNDICDYCGYCSQCCIERATAAGYHDGKCIYDRDDVGAAYAKSCIQCGEDKYPTEICSSCGLCLDCCFENSRANNCECGMCVKATGFSSHKCRKTVIAVRVAGVEIPEIGNMKTVAGIDATGDDIYVVESIKWVAMKDGDDAFRNFNGKTFIKGYTYALRITLKAENYTVFTRDTAVYVNGEEFGGKTVITDEGASAVITVPLAYFPGDKTVEKIDFFVGIPEAGDTISASYGYSGHNYKVQTNGFGWISSNLKKAKYNGYLIKTGKFTGGKYWSVGAIVKPEPGYTVNGDTAIMINGTQLLQTEYSVTDLGDGTFAIVAYVAYVEDTTDIKEVSIKGVQTPTAGVKIDTSGVLPTEYKGYTVSYAYYIRTETGGYSCALYSGSVYQNNNYYKVVICLHATRDRRFSADLSAIVNKVKVDGDVAGSIRVSDDRYYAWITVPLGYSGKATSVGALEIGGVKKPVEGEAVQTTGFTITDKAEIVSTNWLWSEDNDGNYVAVDRRDTYPPEGAYRLRIGVVPKAGYDISKANVTIMSAQCEKEKIGEIYYFTANLSDMEFRRHVDMLDIGEFQTPEAGELITSENLQMDELAVFEGAEALILDYRDCVNWEYSFDGVKFYGVSGIDERFTDGRYYRATLFLEVGEDFVVDNNTAIYIDGCEPDEFHAEYEDDTCYLYITISFGMVKANADHVTAAALRVSAPQAGTTAATHAPFCKSNEFSISGYGWSSSTDGVAFSEFDGTFEEGSYYKISILVEAKDGYFLDLYTSYSVGDSANVSVTQLEGAILVERVYLISGLVGIKAKDVVIDTLPARLEYEVGDEVDVSGLIVIITTDDGTFISRDGDGITVTPGVLAYAGDEVTVTLTCAQASASYPVKVSEVEEKVVGIELISTPDKTEYSVGDTIVLEGIGVRLITNFGSKDVYDTSGITVSPSKFTSVGEQTVTVKNSGHSVNFSVSVSEKKDVVWTQISVAKMPDKSLYVLGDPLNLSGMVIKLEAENEIKYVYDQSLFDISCDDLGSVGTKHVSIRFGGLETGFDINVLDENEHTHSFVLKSNATSHWYECDCGEIKDKEAHVYGDDSVCVVCGFEKAGGEPEATTAPTEESTEQTTAETEPASSTTTGKTDTPASTTSPTHNQGGKEKKSLTWLWIVIIIVAVGGAGAAVAVIITSKNKRNGRV